MYEYISPRGTASCGLDLCDVWDDSEKRSIIQQFKVLKITVGCYTVYTSVTIFSVEDLLP
jgi:hypothetical protein